MAHALRAVEIVPCPVTIKRSGVAVSDGLIPDLNQAASDYVPARKGSGYDGVSIKNVLQMSSGVYFNEDNGYLTHSIGRNSGVS